MLSVADLARRLSTAVSRSAAGPRLRGDDVLAYLRAASETAHTASELELGSDTVARIDRLLATLPRLVVEERLSRRHPGFARYFEALPRIVFMAGRGHSNEEIAGSMHFLATEFGIDAVLRFTADAVAKRLRKG